MCRVKTDISRHSMRRKIIAEAQEWIGTPYHHQAMLKHVGADCVGTVVGIGMRAGAMSMSAEDIRYYGGYSRTPNPKKMKSYLDKFLVAVLDDAVRAGDIAWIHWGDRDMPMHLALLSVGEDGRAVLIHAAAEFKKVVCQDYTEQWQRQTTSFWRYPKLGGICDE